MLSFFVGAIGCDSNELPPPPADAVASCTYEKTPTTQWVDTSTLWFNSKAQIIRIDGQFVEDGLGAVAAPYYFTYDDAGRVIEQRRPDFDTYIDYGTDQITELRGEYTWIRALVDGRVTHEEGPMELAATQRTTWDYTYDADGRVTGISASGPSNPNEPQTTQYTYDGVGRLTSATSAISDREYTSIFTYTEAPGQLTVELSGTGIVAERWTYAFDASQRVVSIAVDYKNDGADDVISAFEYDGDTITETWTTPTQSFQVVARGQCELPSVVVTPRLPLPLPLYADYITLYDATRSSFYHATYWH